MPTSPEKVAAAIDQAATFIDAQLPELQQHASGMQAVALGMVAPYLPAMATQLVARVRTQLPDEPEALDAILDAAAAYVLALKSDPPAIDAGAELDDQADDVDAGRVLELEGTPHRVGCSCADCTSDREAA